MRYIIPIGTGRVFMKEPDNFMRLQVDLGDDDAAKQWCEITELVGARS